MSNTFSQVYIQIIFAVHGRQNLIGQSWKHELNKYISGIITEKKQKSIIVNGVADHIHVFVGLQPAIAIADLVRDIKASSTNFINKKQFTKNTFKWQTGYGVFSYSRSQLELVYAYILHQESHHKKVTFKEVYIGLLKEFEIPYDEKYLFDWNND